MRDVRKASDSGAGIAASLDLLYAVPVVYLVNVAEAAIAYVDAMNAEGLADDTDLFDSVEALRNAK